MERKRIVYILALFVLLGASVEAAADIKMKTRNTSAGNTSEGTVYIKGKRQRSSQSYGGGLEMVTLTQCDLKRTVQINDMAKTYMVSPMVTESPTTNTTAGQPAPSGTQPTTTRRGGVVTYTSTITDTGERKQMFGFTARRIKTSMTIDSTPDACNPTKMRVETDGWYIDLEFSLDCDLDRPMIPPTPPTGARPTCRDEIRFKKSGSARLGYPILLTTTSYIDGGQTFTSTIEVVELSQATLEASLFEIPPGYTEAKDYQAFMGMPSVDSIIRNQSSTAPSVTAPATTKEAGRIRVGVVAITNKTDRSPSLDALRARLIANIIDLNVDAVPLDSRGPAAIEAEAKQKECDFVLYTDVTFLKTSGKAGGLLGRATGIGGLKEKTESKLDYRLFPVPVTTAVLISSSTAKEEGSEDASLGAAARQEANAVVAEVRKRR